MNTSPPSTRSSSSWAVYIAVLHFFLVSGACGLLYQVVWTRKLVLLLGTTSHAVSAVLSIFFLGLALGSLRGGRLADRAANPLRWYGLFEIIIGAWALFFLAALTVGEEGVVWLLRSFGGTRWSAIALRELLACALLFVPVFLMGATLPLLARFVNRKPAIQGARIGTLYTLNTVGAVLGCFLAGFVLLPRLGYTGSTVVGAAANGLIGLLALVVARLAPPEDSAPAPEAAPPRPDAGARHVLGLVLTAFFVSGFCALALEVLWTRLLAIVFLGTTYAYTTMLTTMLCGIALGSAVASAVVDRIRGRVALLGFAFALTGVGCLLMLGWLAGMPDQVRHLPTGNWGAVITGKFILAFAALFVPTFSLGMTFPLVVKIVSAARERLGRDVGRIYFINTMGGVAGAMAGSYLLLPLLGTHWGIVALAMLLVLMGMALLMRCPATPVPWKTALVALAAVAWALAWLRAPEDVNQALTAGYVRDDHHVIHYAEGVEGTVVVSEPKDETEGRDRVLYINRVQATTSIERGVKMNRLQGVLPLLFNREPKDVLFMCFGSGITAGTLALSDFDRIDAVEISPEVLKAAPYFDVDNLGVLDRPGVVFHVDDGRNFLLTTDHRYDVITFEPMPLALAGVSTFYSREYYQLCLKRLKPGGMVSQWIPLHSLNPEVVRSLAHTFTTVFPEYAAWFVNADLFLLGSDAPFVIDYAAAKARLNHPGLKPALEASGLGDVEEVIASFLLDKAGLDAWTAGGRVMTDDRPWAEFIAPKLVYEKKVPESLGEIIPHVPGHITLLDTTTLAPAEEEALERRFQAHRSDLEAVRKYYSGMSIDPSVGDGFKRSLTIDPGDLTARYYLKEIVRTQAEAKIKWGDYDEAVAALEDALTYLPGHPDLRALLTTAQQGRQ